ncbi:hypothetical protein G6F63_005261 [Rhizopus arrhizus]|nr:hypothetical protein G6F63_005261 [Rhizopus arrhizus]
MTDSWDRTLFDKELKSILETKLPVSASKITSLQSLATAHPKHHNYIVQCITRFIENAPPDYRLAGLYVIDAISRAVHKQLRKREENNEKGFFELEGYLKRFAIVLKEDSLQGCFEPCSVKDKDKVKKTLDFWEQGNIYPKEVVDYVKGSFLKQILPPVDTASLLATLSNIGNLNIPGLTTTTTTTTTTTPPQSSVTQQENNDKSLPPALAKLLGGIVTSSPTITPAVPTTPPPPPTRPDPRVAGATNDPRQKPAGVWPPPQGPSISSVNSTRTERRSRWGHDADNNTNKTHMSTTTTTTAPSTTIITANSPVQDPWFNRQAMSQIAAMSNNYQQQQSMYQPQPTNQQYYQQQQQFQLYQQYYSSQFQPQQVQQQPPQQGTQPIHDPSLSPGYIRVLTRTLFVGPIPDHYEKEDVARLFNRYGEIASVIVSKKLKGRHNAFLKFTTRAATEAAKYDGAGLVVEGVPVKVNWGFGFGPKKHFDYNRGDSVIPLSELSAEEKDNLVIARIGGFQGQPVRDRMTIEEPEAQYKPEWKDNDRGGGKRGSHALEDGNNNRKRTRM